MFLKHIFCWILLLPSILGEIKDVSWQLDALDCRTPAYVKTDLLANMCQSSYQTKKIETVSASILVKRPSDTLKAYTCSMFKSSIRTSCGPLNGSEILYPPDIYKSTPFPAHKCKDAIEKNTFVTEDGKTITVEGNNTYHYKYVQQSTLIVGPEKASCTGSTVSLDITNRLGVITLVEIQLNFKEFNVQSNWKDNQIVIPEKCHKHNTCMEGNTAYYIPAHQSTDCPYKQLMTISFESFLVHSPPLSTTVMVSETEGFAFVKAFQEEADTRCPHLPMVTATQYPNIKLITPSSTKLDAKPLTDESISSMLELEQTLKMKAHYLEYIADYRAQKAVYQSSKAICEMYKPLISNIGLSPFHPDSILRVRGELVQEIKCVKLVVEARLGDNRSEYCLNNLLPVWLNYEPLFIQANTRMIVKEMIPSQFECVSRYSPIFTAKDGTLLQAKPDVQRVNISLNQVDAHYLHPVFDAEIQHEEATTPIKTTVEEFIAYKDYVFYQQAKEDVIKSLVYQYCAHGNCGDFNPILGAGKFKIENLQHGKTDSTWNFTRISKLLSWTGNYCSVIVFIYILSRLLIKAINVLRLICCERLSAGSAFRLNFLVSQQLSTILLNGDDRSNQQRENIQLIALNNREISTTNNQNYTTSRTDRRWYN